MVKINNVIILIFHIYCMFNQLSYINAVILYLSLVPDCSGDDVSWTVRHVRRLGYHSRLRFHHKRQARYSSYRRHIGLWWR